MPDTPLTCGGQGGGAGRSGPEGLSRADLRTLRAAIRTGRVPWSEAEREETVAKVMAALRCKSIRMNLAAARVLATLDRLNLSAEVAAARLETPNASVHVNLNLTYEELCKLPHDELIRLHRASLGAPALPDGVADGQGAEGAPDGTEPIPPPTRPAADAGGKR